MPIYRRNLFATSAAVLASAGLRPAFAAAAFAPSADRPSALAAGAAAAFGIDQILSLDKVHLIEIAADPRELYWIDQDRSHHVACDVTIDGEKYKDANFSAKGNIGSSSPLAEKSGFNIRFGKDRPKDMKRLVVNNAKQDITFVHEHLAYEIYRNAGLPATLTAHGAITLNGKPYGVFVMVEPKDSDYLEKWFGKGNGDGHFYKASAPVDFADRYLDPVLEEDDDEAGGAIDAAKRADLAALAEAVNTPDDAFLGKIREHIDLDRFVTHYALDALVASVDGATWMANNYVLYYNPGDNRFVMLPHGIDQAFDVSEDPLRLPSLTLARRVRTIPDLETQWRAEMNRIMRDVWDVRLLAARVDRVVALFQQFKATAGDAIARDVDYIKGFAPGVINLLDGRRAQWLEGRF